jgi:hypothetical protein
MGAKYWIQVEKDGANVTARYDLSVEASSTELLASFVLNVEGKNLIGTFLPQVAFTGTQFCVLADPTKDTEVTFAITTNLPWNVDGEDTLRGEKQYDDVAFEN